MQNTDISNLMTSIVDNLVPVCSREANPDLWLIYDQMQIWAFQVRHPTPLTQSEDAARAVEAITCHLGKLRNRTLAREIARVIKRHSAPATRAVKTAAIH